MVRPYSMHYTILCIFFRNSSVDVMNTSRACRLHCAVFIIFLVCVTADVDGPYRLPTLCEGQVKPAN